MGIISSASLRKLIIMISEFPLPCICFCFLCGPFVYWFHLCYFILKVFLTWLLVMGECPLILEKVVVKGWSIGPRWEGPTVGHQTVTACRLISPWDGQATSVPRPVVTWAWLLRTWLYGGEGGQDRATTYDSDLPLLSPPSLFPPLHLLYLCIFKMSSSWNSLVHNPIYGLHDINEVNYSTYGCQPISCPQGPYSISFIQTLSPLSSMSLFTQPGWHP